jgi:hypothetical protein
MGESDPGYQGGRRLGLAMPEGRLERIIATAADSIGDISAVGISALLSGVGPEASYIGAAAGPVVAGVAQDIASRVLSRKEERRLGSVIVYAAASMRQLHESGARLREDGFWSSNPDQTKPGEEVVEAVLLAAQREPQERKLEYLGCLLAQIAYHEEIPVETAMWMIGTAERLTWTQYVLISMVGRSQQFELSGIEVGQNIGSWRGWAVHQELQSMGPFGMSIMGAKARETVPAYKGLFNMNLSDFHLGNGGRLLYDFLGVGDIPAEEINDLIRALRDVPEEQQSNPDLGQA